uniref:Uncharacterized protein n=1 Tax=Cacopsylla melanoneura TaxID=428564 RepID=A0A8D8T4E0_9HEMI
MIILLHLMIQLHSLVPLHFTVLLLSLVDLLQLIHSHLLLLRSLTMSIPRLPLTPSLSQFLILLPILQARVVPVLLRREGKTGEEGGIRKNKEGAGNVRIKKREVKKYKGGKKRYLS